jgi:hypothetical protein
MSEHKSKEPTAQEMEYPLHSEFERHPNSPRATAARPQAQQPQQSGAGGAPGIGEPPPEEGLSVSDEAKNQWATSQKIWAESGTP